MKTNKEYYQLRRAKDVEAVRTYDRLSHKKWRETHQEYENERNRTRYNTNPEVHRKRRAYIKLRMVKKREKAFHVLGHICVRCGQFDKRLLEFDHIVPIDKSIPRPRTVDVANWIIKNAEIAKQYYQVLCHSCNIKKSHEQKVTHNE